MQWRPALASSSSQYYLPPSCFNTRKHNRAGNSVLQVQGQSYTTASDATGSWSTQHTTERRTPRRCSHGRFISTATSESRGVFQLGQLTQSSALQDIWQDVIQQSCHAAWQELRELAFRQLSIQASGNNSASRPDAEQQHPMQQIWPEQLLLKLDSLLGTLQQVLLICGLLKDHHAKQEWQTVAAAVFIAARTLEQDICSDTLLPQGLLLAQQQLILQQQNHSNSSSRHPHQSGSPAAAAVVTPLSSHLLLAKTLTKHMQLEGLNPRGFAGRATSQNPGSTAQVLTLQEQRAILSGLQAEHRVLLNRMQELLRSPAAAPVVQMDAGSLAVLLQHSTRASGDAAAVAAGNGNSDPGPQVLAAAAAAAKCPIAAAAGDCNSDPGPQLLAAAAAEHQLIDVVLDLDLIQHVLQDHPDADVRSDVYASGVLQQLDKLLLMWKDLAESRRKVASNQGHTSYADFILQHSLLGSHAAAVEVCEQIAAALQPAALTAAQKLLQHQRYQCNQQQRQERRQQKKEKEGQDENEAAAANVTDEMHVQGSDLAYLLHQECLELISSEDLQQLQPYLQFEHVMTGFDQLLQLSLGLSLTPRPAAAGEIWNDRVLVYDLCDLCETSDIDQLPPLQQQQQQQQQAGDAVNNTQASAAITSPEGVRLGSEEARFGSEEASSNHGALTPRGSSSRRLLGTVYIDPSGGFSAQLVVYGSQYQGTAQLNKQQQRQQLPLQPDEPAGLPCSTASQSLNKANRSSNLQPFAPTSVPCAVALGLQSRGVLGGTHSQLARGLWELCHELGHAVNFILSANTNRAQQSKGSQQLAAGLTQDPQEQPVAAATAPSGQLHHMHSAWLPLEVLELPSTLFEVFCMNSMCLQVLCQHCGTDEKLPDELASKLAAFMRHSHYHPVEYQQMVLGMLFDLQMAGITGRQLGRHAAHATWQEVMTTDGLTATPHVEVTMQQVLTQSRLLVSSGQGYGYVIAYCLAQLLWPSLLWQVRHSLGTASQHKDNRGRNGTNPTHEGDAGVHIRSVVSGTGAPGDTRGLWRRLLGGGAELSDLKFLVQSTVQLQQASAGSAAVAEECEQIHVGAVKGSGWAAAGGACDTCSVAQALQDCGMWPLEQSSNYDPEDLLLVCLSCALRKLRCSAECNGKCQCKLGCHDTRCGPVEV